MLLLLLLGSALSLRVTFLIPTSFSTAMWMPPFLGFFSNGIFSGFPVALLTNVVAWRAE
jgi:hypothetical protein